MTSRGYCKRYMQDIGLTKRFEPCYVGRGGERKGTFIYPNPWRTQINEQTSESEHNTMSTHPGFEFTRKKIDENSNGKINHQSKIGIQGIAKIVDCSANSSLLQELRQSENVVPKTEVPPPVLHSTLP